MCFFKFFYLIYHSKEVALLTIIHPKLLLADPMVDVMQEIATRVNISPFYVSFALAPLGKFDVLF